jgi:hypothetical protein
LKIYFVDFDCWTVDVVAPVVDVDFDVVAVENENASVIEKVLHTDDDDAAEDVALDLS